MAGNFASPCSEEVLPGIIFALAVVAVFVDSWLKEKRKISKVNGKGLKWVADKLVIGSRAVIQNKLQPDQRFDSSTRYLVSGVNSTQ